MPISRDEFRDRINQHRLSLQVGIQRITDELFGRAIKHDIDKLKEENFEVFYLAQKNFANVKFCSDGHKKAMESLKPAIDEHYKVAEHHPQHHENGVNGMTLIDMLEMLVDWKSANVAYCNGGTFIESMKSNKERFNIDDQLFSVLVNTARHLGYLGDE